MSLGASVACMTATKGERGFGPGSDYTMETMAACREQEMKHCMKIYGVDDHSWMGFIDGELAADNPSAVQQISDKIASFNPDLIVTFDKTGITGHPDHIAVSHWVELAVRTSKDPCPVIHPVIKREWYENEGKRLDEELNLYFNIDQPPLADESECDMCIELNDHELEQKLAGLHAQKSQTNGLFNTLDAMQLKRMLSFEYFLKS